MKLRGMGIGGSVNQAGGRSELMAGRAELARFFGAGALLLALCAAPGCGKDQSEPHRPSAVPSASAAVHPAPNASAARQLSEPEQSALDTELQAAVYWGRDDLIPGLVSKGANPNSKNSVGFTLLSNAFVWQKGHEYHYDKGATYRVIESLLQNGADPSLAGSRFIEAAAFRCTKMVELFLQNGMDPNYQDYEGRTALMAVADRNPAFNQQYAWNIFCQSSDFPSSLYQALLEAGADVNLTDGDGQSALAILSAQERPDRHLGTLLIEHGADVNSADRHGRTPLHNARDGWFIRMLAENGADANLHDRDGTTPLMRHWEYAELLLAHGADAMTVDRDGNTVLHYSLRQGDYPEPGIIKALVDRGANPNAREYRHGKTPFMLAAGRCVIPAMQALLDCGADPAIRDSEGNDAYAQVRQMRLDIRSQLARMGPESIGSRRAGMLRLELYSVDAALDFLKSHRTR